MHLRVFSLKRTSVKLYLTMQTPKKICIVCLDKWPSALVPETFIHIMPVVNGPVPMVKRARIQDVRRPRIVPVQCCECVNLRKVARVVPVGIYIYLCVHIKIATALYRWPSSPDIKFDALPTPSFAYTSPVCRGAAAAFKKLVQRGGARLGQSNNKYFRHWLHGS
jgi:hypothetical protein